MSAFLTMSSDGELEHCRSLRRIEKGGTAARPAPRAKRSALIAFPSGRSHRNVGRCCCVRSLPAGRGLVTLVRRVFLSEPVAYVPWWTYSELLTVLARREQARERNQ